MAPPRSLPSSSRSLFRIALAQINSVVGDIDGNVTRIRDVARSAARWRPDLLAFPELTLVGYPPEDLLLKPQFRTDQAKALRRVASLATAFPMVVGYVDEDPAGLYNAAAIVFRGRIQASYRKVCLPNYGVFDERRYFTPGREALVATVRGVRVGLSICEDLWVEQGPPLVEARRGGAQVLLSISASPYHAGKHGERKRLFSRRAREARAHLAYLNLVGGQDELVFDGASMILGPDGTLLGEAKLFEEDLLVADLEVSRGTRGAGRSRGGGVGGGGSRAGAELRVKQEKVPGASAAGASAAGPSAASRAAASGGDAGAHLPKRPRPRAMSREEEVYAALALGVSDYVRKNGFQTVVLGLSGGIDSALTALIAVDALGADRVVTVGMPSEFSSRATQRDARLVAQRLGTRWLELPIHRLVRAYRQTLAPVFRGAAPNVAEENIQARIRGNLLMALSNKFGWLVLTTGNKSELATGYCTLYGDMAGGLAVLKDVPKQMVYRLAAHRNQRGPGPVIPASLMKRAPTAELRRGQKDQDSLPPYDLLDQVLEAYIEQDAGYAALLRRGFPVRTVQKVIRLVDRNEYKRRQGCPGIKITPKAFGRDRRMPITNQYRPFE